MKLPPIIVFLLPVLTGWLVAWRLPSSILMLQWQLPLALLIIGLATILLLLAVSGFRLKRTTVNPLNPEQVTSLVTDGIYRISRNPMYLGMALMAGGISLGLGHMAGLAALPIAIYYINMAQIRPEEAVLTERFGQDYLEYCKAVRRWV